MDISDLHRDMTTGFQQANRDITTLTTLVTTLFQRVMIELDTQNKILNAFDIRLDNMQNTILTQQEVIKTIQDDLVAYLHYQKS